MNSEVKKISVDKIIPNRFQPRKNFDEEALQELANSIRQHGIIQPLVLRKLGESFEIIAGERRYKAAMRVGLREVPAIVMELDDTSSAEIALIENIQRKDLTAIEEAKSYEKILELGQLNQEDLAKRIGRNQSTVSNKLRLLNLSQEAQQALLDNKISERHARSLLRLKDEVKQNEMLNKIIENRMTVRETDKEIKNILGENNSDSFEIEEIIDINDDITFNSSTDKLNNDITASNNQVYINPEIVPPLENTNPSFIELPETNNSPIEIDLPKIDIPEYDQIGIIPPEIPMIKENTNEDNMTSEMNQGPFGSRFFNLDNETPNMNMGNTYNDSSENSINPNQFIPNGLPNFNEHQLNETSINENIRQQPIIQRQDITGAVAVIRNTIMNLQNNGYMITTNEQDLGDSHQIIIKINK